MKFERGIKLFASIVICELAGIIGSIFTTPSISGWYAGLTRPFFNPPNWLFGPVWTTLFVLMGIALYLIWVKGKKTVKARWIFALQLFLNLMWSILFFYFKMPMLAFFELIVLWAAIVWTMLEFNKFSKTAAWLLLPYILWVSFAGMLNFFLWQLN